MAILKFGTLVTGARGTLGGITFSANKAGPYCKPWAAPPKTTTTKRSVIQGEFAGFGSAWSALSAAQRTAWNDFGAAAGQAQTNALGETYYLSGWQWFVKLNGWRVQTYDPTGLGSPVITPAIIEDAPTGSPATPPTISALEAHYTAPQEFTVTFTPDIGISGVYYLLEAAQIFSTVAEYTPPTFAAIRAFENGDSSPVTITSEIPLVFGALRPGAQLAVRLYALPVDGYRSAAAQLSCAVEA